jgi:hypothetical protein
MYDHLIFYSKISLEDLVSIIQSDLQSIIDDKLTIIAKDQDDKFLDVTKVLNLVDYHISTRL